MRRQGSRERYRGIACRANWPRKPAWEDALADPLLEGRGCPSSSGSGALLRAYRVEPNDKQWL